MKDYDDTTYGDKIADVYDEFYAAFDPDSIELLKELAGEGPALELGIGTGRIALPLIEKGVSVSGIDASEAMLARLKAKQNGDKIDTHTGSFAEFKIEKKFKLIYVVFNTFFSLLTQEEQVRCFKSVAEHLTPDGVFLLEVFVPDPCRFIDNQDIRTTGIDAETTHFDTSLYDPLTQQVSSQHVILSKEGIRLYPVKIRFAWPSELNLMACLAGLTLKHRWGNWTKGEFNHNCKTHISVYGRTK